MRTRPLLPAALFVLAGALLAGCTFSVGQDTAPTVPPEELASLTADQLEAEVGTRPDIDCGSEPVPVEVGSSVTCLLVDPVARLEFDVLLTFTDLTGGTYDFDITVADVPNNAPQPTAEPGATVPVEDIEALAISALAPGLGYVPVVDCDATEVQIVVGNAVACSYDGTEGPVDVVVTITQFDGSEYTVRVTEA